MIKRQIFQSSKYESPLSSLRDFFFATPSFWKALFFLLSLFSTKVRSLPAVCHLRGLLSPKFLRRRPREGSLISRILGLRGKTQRPHRQPPVTQTWGGELRISQGIYSPISPLSFLGKISFFLPLPFFPILSFPCSTSRPQSWTNFKCLVMPKAAVIHAHLIFVSVTFFF